MPSAVARWMDKSLDEISVIQGFARSRGEHQIHGTSFDQASSLPQRGVHDRTEGDTPFRPARLHAAEMTPIAGFNHPQEPALKIHPPPPQSQNFFNPQ